MGAGDCQWGGLTDQNVCNIHGDAPKFRAVGPSAAAGEAMTYGRKEGKLGNIYRCMSLLCATKKQLDLQYSTPEYCKKASLKCRLFRKVSFLLGKRVHATASIKNLGRRWLVYTEL